MSSSYQANKNLGQHFLVNKKIIELIINDFASVSSAIIEIGPGPGALTQYLSQHPHTLLLVEKDQRFFQNLKNYASEKNIFMQDALKMQLSSLFNDHDIYWLVSNLPYNISSQLFIKFVQIPQITYMTLMFQREVGIKTTSFSQQSSQKMSSLQAISQTYFQTKTLCKVAPGSFSPPPKVHSIVISYQRRERPIIGLNDFPSFEVFLRKLFSHRRKKMLSGLKSFLPMIDWLGYFQQQSLDPNIRAEDLTLDQVHHLFLKSKLWEK